MAKLKSPTALIARFDSAQSQLVVQTADLPLGTLAGMVDSGAIDLTPSFQRRERWGREKQSALIESFLLNVPVPPVYLSEEDDGTYTAIDGKQRLQAISKFMSNDLKLHSLERLDIAEGLTFTDLPPEIANPLRLRPYLRVVTLLKQTEAALKYEVFLRLNRGGEVLNAQEIRNVAFRGPMNDAIYELTGNAFLRRQLKIVGPSSSAFKGMNDAEYVLRFLTLRERQRGFSGKLAFEMNKFMGTYQFAPTHEIAEHRRRFERAIGYCEKLWGANAFKRPDGNGWRDQLLAGMYDAQMLAVDNVPDGQLEHAIGNRARVGLQIRNLFADSNFETAVRTGTNTPARIDYRVREVTALLEAL